jgi:hypothetical protein
MDSSINTVREKDQAIDVVTRLFIHTATGIGKRSRPLFTPSVLFDMTSIAGGQPSISTSQQIVDEWNKGLKPMKAIHHQAGNFLVDILRMKQWFSATASPGTSCRTRRTETRGVLSGVTTFIC